MTKIVFEYSNFSAIEILCITIIIILFSCYSPNTVRKTMSVHIGLEQMILIYGADTVCVHYS